MTPEDDHALASAFAELRREEETRTPPFEEMVRRGRTQPARATGRLGTRPLWLAAAVALAVLGIWLGLRSRHPAAPSLAEWRSPTDFLLATPGRDLLVAPAWDRSVLDLREVPLTSQPERRSPS